MGTKLSNPLLWSEHISFPLLNLLPQQELKPDLGKTIYLCESGLLSLKIDLAEDSATCFSDSKPEK